MAAISPKAIAAVVVTAVALPLLIIGRSYPWQLAAPVAIAAGLLVYSTLSTLARIRPRKRPRRSE